CPRRQVSSLPVVTSHNRAVRSCPVLARWEPLGEKVTPYTLPRWPVRATFCSPVETSQSLTLPSSPALASQRSSGLKVPLWRPSPELAKVTFGAPGPAPLIASLG